MKKRLTLRHTHDSYILTEITQCTLQALVQFYVNHVSVNDFLHTNDPVIVKATKVFLSFTKEEERDNPG
ncbi:hypothetical protein [[Flexibacter] sp. ATCC 35208]|uniref:hypothetical protein n=1 Tax=[Flexibacter] sp. ATCC 35208 TaxID=1936242 RepID=UPI0009CAFF14|nr:hypothetical protein [[Flexibacter] sp. ATCC 35208]OMP74711.1 hypothetical protein BW716_33955 [[Flexibacter] sp. ATCC 35208]